MERLKAVFLHLVRGAPWGSIGVLAFATVLYVLGLTVVYVPVVIWLLAKYVPLPGVFRSWLSRIVVSILLFYCLFQLAVVVQFFVFPDSGFRALGMLAALAVALLLIVVRFRAPEPARGRLVDRSDVVAGIAVACFVVPFVLFAGLGRGDPLAITRLAGVQSYDAVNHFMGELEMAKAQHLTYRTVDYYPKGFHLTTMFIQNGSGLNVAHMDWTSVARVFMGQYVAFGAVLAYTFVYACLAFYRMVASKLAPDWITGIALGLAAGVTVTLFYLLPFMHQGFINYCYSIASVICGLLYVLDLFRRPPGLFRPHWYIFGYFLFLFGLSMSWPLLIPPFVAIGVLCMLPDTFMVRRLIAGHWSWGGAAVVAGVLLQFVPIYFQLKYWALSTGDGLNTPGSITAFHYALLVAGLAAMIYVLLWSDVSTQIRRFVFCGVCTALYFCRRTGCLPVLYSRRGAVLCHQGGVFIGDPVAGSGSGVGCALVCD